MLIKQYLDLRAMGLLGQQDHPAIEHSIRTVKAAGKPVGVNAFAKPTPARYLGAGVDFILVGADVALLARGGEALATGYIPASDAGPATGY